MIVQIASGILVLLVFSFQGTYQETSFEAIEAWTSRLTHLRNSVNLWANNLERKFIASESELVSLRASQIDRVQFSSRTVAKNILIGKVDAADNVGINISTCLYDGNEVRVSIYFDFLRKVQKCFNDDLDYIRHEYYGIHEGGGSLMKRINAVAQICKNTQKKDYTSCVDEEVTILTNKFGSVQHRAETFETFLGTPSAAAMNCSRTNLPLFDQSLQSSARVTLRCIEDRMKKEGVNRK